MRKVNPPVARIKAKKYSIHEEKIVDNYYWLREKENPEVQKYLEEENKYSEAIMKHTEEFQKQLFEEMKGRIKEDDISAPEQMGNYQYYWREEKDNQYKDYYRKRISGTAEEELLLDLNALAASFEYLAVGLFKISPDQNLLAYSLDTTGSEHFEIHIKDLKRNTIFKEKITDTYYGLEWANENQTLFYTKVDEKNRPYQLWRHKIGTDPKNDEIVYHEEDEAFHLYLFKTKDFKYLLLSAQSQVTTEYRYLNTNDPLNSFQIIKPRQQNVEYYVAHQLDNFIIRTNEKAKNFRIMKKSVNDQRAQDWEEIVPHRETVLITNFEVFENHLVLYEKKEGLTNIRIIDNNTREAYYVDMPEKVYNCQKPPWYKLLVPLRFETNLLRFNYSSLVTPPSVIDFNMVTKERKLVKQKEILGGFDTNTYDTKRITVQATDRKKIFISLVHKKGLAMNGENPLLLYGYGAYGENIDPEFKSQRLSLLDRGFIYAIAHIRGSSYLGRTWYEDGKLLNKKNTFKDFILCAEHLINDKYTSKEKLFIQGASAGGLLMGAVLNMRPDLFKGVIAEVPFIDVINDMLDPSIPLVVIEYEEWGNPQDKKFFDYMKSYSPYDNIEKKAYPNILLTGGLNDPRVLYWEPAKMTAKLRQLKTDDNRLLLKMNMETGHFGKSGRFDYLKEIAFIYTFMLDLVGDLH
ncbi:MAG: S9 family peptidase [Candidatus Hodarchaeales archaeon]|jgi:oligopeptidase B